MGGVRRSGRIKKQVGILLLGTDTSGRVFSEETIAVVLSRHGAGIISTHRVAPDEILTLRLLGSSREAEVRLVGQMGQETRGWTYGVAFVDASLDFWQIEFPPPTTPCATELDQALECSICHTRQVVHQSEIEVDVYMIAEGILRSCDSCGTSTLWRRATGEYIPRATEPKTVPVLPCTTNKNGTALGPDSPSGSTLVTNPSMPARSFETAVMVEPSAEMVAPAEVHRETSPHVPWDRTTNRRSSVRTGVTFTACIHRAGSDDEIVECDNISRGGLCFRSRKTYPVDSLVEVAAPYSPGWHAIFIPASIKHVEQLPGGKLFRYGVAYTQPLRSSRTP